ncbi:glutamate-5-semialdehyde dehydrogenase [Thermosyntropha sp.]|uniref:glutamate-5-semialdehyde dehydrogenase n=1 Tax=Thermosyntropha sp. TaxID=2740820 RepID=UPI0025F2BE80|nr:glutamate-5-semialdehyde dehydrogenase [Thermosyntropha sp.]MBO8158707.1 glutamate-5-semialdehyde dehydrogenase [Thermosyntropha sp.]
MLMEQGKKARKAARFLATASTDIKNKALNAMADALEANQEEIIKNNRLDLEAGEKMGLTSAMLERLTLNPSRIEAMAEGLREIALLPDPVGEVLGMVKRPNGLDIGRIRTPIGVIGIIYESRPNVTADAAGLCLKSGNAIILRGGEEALNSNRVIARTLSHAAESCGIPEGAIQLVDSVDREAALFMMKMHDYLDVLIPRGGKGLKKAVQENASVPVIMTGMGNCHVYIDEFADLDKAVRIAFNAKVQRPSVCNACETLLVHEKIASRFLPLIVEKYKEASVEIRGCEKVREIIADGIKPATEADWEEEYLDLIIAVKVVQSIDEAIDHINTYGTGHSEAIVTENYTNSRLFMAAVDAAAVYTNASTRFTDGGVFGFGAEMGISTQKLHARGPMGLKELTTTKFVIYGDGQIRE